MKNLKISTRLSGAFALLVLMLLGVTVAAMTQLAAMRSATAEITDNWLPSVEVVNAIDAQTAELRMIVLTHIMNTDAAEIAKIDKRLMDGRAKLVELRKQYERLISTPEEKSSTTSLQPIGASTFPSTMVPWSCLARTRTTTPAPS